MNTTSLKNTRHQDIMTSIFVALVLTFGILAAFSVAASAQELYILSTDSGMEIYQVERLRGPDLQLTSYHGPFPQDVEVGNFKNQPVLSTYGIMGRSLVVHSGLQTTLNGRILMMAGKIDWQPSFGNNAMKGDLVASLNPGLPQIEMIGQRFTWQTNQQADSLPAE